ncbi:MAG: S8 family peptidase [Rhodoferax sp.]|nr:MAG: S8 family peptidase [Rhodoferax sp.]
MASKKKQNQERRNGNPSNLSPNTENPFIVIAHGPNDLEGHGGSQGPSKELVTVDQAFCTALNETLDITSAILGPTLERYPNLPVGTVLRLREDGIAKSHRPLKLLQAANLQPAGHANIDEMLVGANAAALTKLRALIADGPNGKLKANLSTLLRIEPWSRARRNPEGTLALRERGQAILRPHRFYDREIDIATRAAMYEQLARLNIHTRTITLGMSEVILLPNLDAVSDERLDDLLDHPAVRTLSADQLVGPVATGQPAMVIPPTLHFPAPTAGLPTVAVFDTGVAPGHATLQGWVTSNEVFVLPPDTNFEHGSNVASLVAGGSRLNPNFPDYSCLVHNVTGLKSSTSQISDLMLDLETAVTNRPDIKVWNLSLGSVIPCSDHIFSDFAQKLDELSDRFQVLFVVAAGNHLIDPRRAWPTELAGGEDRISSPADSVRALTVGSVAHADAADTVVRAWEPAPYSRRGMGPVFTPKPDIVHFGGNVHHTGNPEAPWKPGNTSIAVLTAGNEIGHGYGTSYAAPLASAMAAHTWAALQGNAALPPSPHLVKALLIHAAQISSPEFTPVERKYHGSGLPSNVLDVLYDRDDSFTLAFEAHLTPGRMRWRKTPYPVPQALLPGGKFRGEVIITAAYAPPLNGNYGAEYIRANLELNWGFVEDGGFNGRVPWDGEKGSTGLEIQQVEHGGKWSPVKTQRRVFAEGIQGGDAWALQAKMVQRAFELKPDDAMRVAIIVTLRSLDGDPNVHSQGIQALNATNWVRSNLPVQVPVQI